MKAAFVHDHYFVYNSKDGKYYDGSGGLFNEQLWKRYLAVFNELIVVGRQKDELPNKLVDSTYKNVSFELIDILKKNTDRIFKKQQIYNELEKTLNKVDFVIIRLPSVLGYIAQEICINNEIKYTLEIVTCPWDAYWNYGSITGKIIAPLEFLKMKKACKKANNVIYVTESFLQSRYPTENNQINISNVLINGRKDWESILDFYNKESSVFRIGLIGSFHVKWKGHLEAIKAIRILKEKGYKNIQLELVGTGNSDWVKEIINQESVQDMVNIIGTVEAGEKGIFPFLDSLHLYIHPSKQEGLPRVVIEALSRGRLVLGSSAAGIPELLDKEFLHNPGDYNKLAEQIENMYNLKSNRDEVIEQNWNKSQKYFENELQENRENFLKKISK